MEDVMNMKMTKVSIMVVLILAGTVSAGEMIRLTCPECGCSSGDLCIGLGKSARGHNTIFFEPAEGRFMGVFMNVGLLFQESKGVELEHSFFSGGGDEEELWEEYIEFFSETAWPDTIWLADIPAWFSFDVPEIRLDGYLVRMEEPYWCPLCEGLMDYEVTGLWD